MSVQDYLSAVKIGKKEYHACVNKGTYPYLPVLEDIIDENSIEVLAEDTAKYGACVLGVFAKDTIKICDENGFVVDTPNRKLLWHAQTPQCFKYDVIKKGL